MRPLSELETRYVGIDRRARHMPREHSGPREPAASVSTLRRRRALFLQTDRNDEVRQK